MKSTTLNERMSGLRTRGPLATALRVEGGVLHLTLGGAATEGVVVSVPAARLSGLAGLSDEQLGQGRFLGGGTALWWPGVNVDILLTSLLETATGLRSHREAQRRAGSATSELKAAAVRANGAKGGRPRKTALS